jgi:hypothetical protein
MTLGDLRVVCATEQAPSEKHVFTLDRTMYSPLKND